MCLMRLKFEMLRSRKIMCRQKRVRKRFLGCDGLVERACSRFRENFEISRFRPLRAFSRLHSRSPGRTPISVDALMSTSHCRRFSIVIRWHGRIRNAGEDHSVVIGHGVEFGHASSSPPIHTISPRRRNKFRSIKTSWHSNLEHRK